MKPKSKVSDRFPSSDVFFGTSPDLPRIVELDCGKIVWNPDQPRKSVDPERLQELADSIVSNGLIHPITVKRTDTDHYMIIAGERRFRAFGLLERVSIPAIISEGSIDELALIENIQREDLSPIDEYQAIARLMEKHGYSQGDAATTLGKSRVTINELMSLAGLPSAILDEASATKVSKSVLVEIARAGDEAAQLQLWQEVQAGASTVRALRARKSAPAGEAPKPSPLALAIRAGRKFADALAAIPDDNAAELAEAKSHAARSISLLDKHVLSGE
jgi:ParB family transcriptional regulator, chromosome partitioning protein